VSANGKASRPPTSSASHSAISDCTHSGVNRQRAASCTSTQSLVCAPDANK